MRWTAIQYSAKPTKKTADQDRRQREIRRDAERAADQIKRHHPGNDHGAVGEIDHVHHAPNQREPHGC